MTYNSPVNGNWYMGRGTAYAVVYARPQEAWYIEAAPGGDGFRPVEEFSTKKKALEKARRKAKDDKPSVLMNYSKDGEELERTRY